MISFVSNSPQKQRKDISCKFLQYKPDTICYLARESTQSIPTKFLIISDIWKFVMLYLPMTMTYVYIPFFTIHTRTLIWTAFLHFPIQFSQFFVHFFFHASTTTIKLLLQPISQEHKKALTSLVEYLYAGIPSTNNKQACWTGIGEMFKL